MSGAVEKSLSILEYLAAFPEGVRRAMYEAAHTPSDRMRAVGIASAIIGVAIIWAVRQAS